MDSNTEGEHQLSTNRTTTTTSTMKSVIALALVAAAAADNTPYRPAPAPYKPAYQPAAYKEEPTAAPVYQYNYAVQDQYANLDFEQAENRDNYATSGSYRVALPDGRIQTVTYNTADAYSGNIAEVTYEGQAQYPEEPKYKAAPAPYKPVYKPAPPAYQA